MALRHVDDRSFGDSQVDIREELIRYSTENVYVAEKFADCVCLCGNQVFSLLMDDSTGAAARICHRCDTDHGIGDSDEYYNEAEPWMCECLCGGELFEITVGVALYADSEDVRWIYIGARCPDCGLTGCYGDWKMQWNGYQTLLANV